MRRRFIPIFVFVLLSTTSFAQTSVSAVYNPLNFLIPGITRIQQGDSSGYFTAPGTACALGGTIYMLSRSQGLTLYDDLPYALATTLSVYGNESLLFDTTDWKAGNDQPTIQRPSYLETLALPFTGRITDIKTWANVGILSAFALYSFANSSGDISAFFQSPTVPLWGQRMNPYLAASCFLGYTVLTNLFVATSEETACRSILMDNVLIKQAGLNETAALLTSAAIFGAFHLSNLLLKANDASYRNRVFKQSANAALLGLILGYVYLNDDSPGHQDGFAQAVRFHFLNNVIAFNAGYWIDIGKKKRAAAAPAPSASAGAGSRASGNGLQPAMALSLSPFQLVLNVAY